MSTTHKELVQRAAHWLKNTRKCSVTFAEIVTSSWVIPDAIGFSSHWSVLVECKTSRSDFFNDLKKAIHKHPDSCPGQERWYMTPPGLVEPSEVPEAWGLLEVGPKQVRLLKVPWEPHWLPKDKYCNGKQWLSLSGKVVSHPRSTADMQILFSACRRHQLGVRWFDKMARFETVKEQGR